MKKLFLNYKDKKIALYGLGLETQKAICALKNDFDIIGLLDGFREEGELYGKTIISVSDAIRNGVCLIIVVARPGSCKAISKKIGNVCKENGIALMDIRGKNLLAKKGVSYSFKNGDGMTKEKLQKKILEADIISFDLFDTLVMRQTLSQDDIIAYMDHYLQDKGIILEGFCDRRVESEKVLSRDKAPTLIEIYQHLLKTIETEFLNDISAEQLAELEWKIDFNLIIPRKDVCDIFNKVVDSDKKVYIVSDSYYGKEQLAQILEKCGITSYIDILSSSDYKTGKRKNLFEILKKKEHGKRYLHIGDDVVSDIESGLKHGFETYKLMSAIELLEMLGNLGFEKYLQALSDRLKIGMFIAKIFNSPFQFENENRKIEISEAYDIGYLICAPMISDFVCWFYERTQKQNFVNIWFSARDGYLIKKLYNYLMKISYHEDNSVYFLTSRIAAIRAGVINDQDIKYVDDMKFSGTLRECLEKRFGINVKDVDYKDVIDHETGLLCYKKSIIEKAQNEYINYQKYISSLNVEDGDIAFFDFVAKGTSQMYIQRLITNHLKGFYFMQLEVENMQDKELNIQSFYTIEEGKSCSIFDDYYILETFLTAPHPSVLGFDEYGKPKYAVESRKEGDLNCLLQVQRGITDYFANYIAICPEEHRMVNRELDNIFLGLIHKFKFTNKDFLQLVVEDPFFNRMTNIDDIL